MFGSMISRMVSPILGMVAMGAVALGISGRARQLTFAFSSFSWLIASIIGPTYSAWIISLLSWRWAMLIYLPFFLITRLFIVHNIREKSINKQSNFDSKTTFIIIIGISLITFPLSSTILRILTTIIGICCLLYTSFQLLPKGTFYKNSIRHRALLMLFLLSGVYFAADDIISLMAHDLFNANIVEMSTILMIAGIAWSGVGIYCGIKPASNFTHYKKRAFFGLSLITIAIFSITLVVLIKPLYLITYLIILWGIAGFGMGWIYLDTLNILFDPPEKDDGISPKEMGVASSLVETLSSEITISFSLSTVAFAYAKNQTPSAMPFNIVWIILCIIIILTFISLFTLRKTHR